MTTAGDDPPPPGDDPPPDSTADPVAPSEPVTPAEHVESAGIGRPFAAQSTAPSTSAGARSSTLAASSTPNLSDAEPLIPSALPRDALADAVGIKSRDVPARGDDGDDDDDDGLAADGRGGGWRRNKTLIAVVAGALVVGVGTASLVLLGRVNSERYVLDCTTSAAVAKQGRSFPPWGETPLSGAQWRPIPLPPNAQCKSDEFSERSMLEAKFLDVLLERASASLSAHDFVESLDAKASPLDPLSAQLEQALLLSRAPERGDQRKQVERLLGDVQYWRASVRLRDAKSALADAAKQFDAAALQRPLHVSDAGAWAEFLRHLTDEPHAGPTGAAAAAVAPAPTGDARIPAAEGAALPVEAPAAGSDAPASLPDAGLPTGGVLL